MEQTELNFPAATLKRAAEWGNIPETDLTFEQDTEDPDRCIVNYKTPVALFWLGYSIKGMFSMRNKNI